MKKIIYKILALLFYFAIGYFVMYAIFIIHTFILLYF